MKNVPGRKTDVPDSEWLCDLVEHGLVRPSFVPPREIGDLRDLTRYRKALIQERTRQVQRLEKVLQDAGIKLCSVASKVLGASGRAMIETLCQGTADPEALAELARGRLRAKLPALREALEGAFRPHHALLASRILAHVDCLEETIDALSIEIERVMAPFSRERELLDSIPGVNRRAAETILAEIAADTCRLPSAHHLASWAGMCPGNNESGGKRCSGRSRKGTGTCATSSPRWRGPPWGPGTATTGPFNRLVRRLGKKKAIKAVAHAILVATYPHALPGRPPTRTWGPTTSSAARTRDAHVRRLLRELKALGHKVTIEVVAQTA